MEERPRMMARSICNIVVVYDLDSPVSSHAPPGAAKDGVGTVVAEGEGRVER